METTLALALASNTGQGVRKVQCAEQMESMYQEVTGAVKGAPVIVVDWNIVADRLFLRN